MNVDAFEAFVQTLAIEVSGDGSAMTRKLSTLGFSCTSATGTEKFECVRFACEECLIGPNPLIQWTVVRDFVAGKATFSGAAINYAWAATCVPESDIAAAQKRFLSKATISE